MSDRTTPFPNRSLTEPPTRAQACLYEIESSWWACYCHVEWAQNLAASYFSWKVKRKMGRVEQNRAIMKQIERNYLITGKLS